MRPDSSHEFEACWPVVARELEAILSRRGIDRYTREDLVQETALRLLQRWHDLDKDRPLVPLAATIALNLLRDGFRRAKHEVRSECDLTEAIEVEASHSYGDVEREGLARLEFTRVAKAMRSLSPLHREVLLASVADPEPEASPAECSAPLLRSIQTAAHRPSSVGQGRSSAATKMLRMRARRRLLATLEAAGVAVCTLRLKMSQILQDPAHTAAAVGATAVLLTGLMIPASDSFEGPSLAAPRGISPAGEVGARLSAVVPLRRNGPAAASGGHHREVVTAHSSLLNAPPRQPSSTDMPRTEVETGVSIDPGGNTVLKANVGPVQIEVSGNAPDQSYGLCVAVETEPVEEDACSSD